MKLDGKIPVERDLHMVFIDLEIVYYMVLREILWKALEKKKVSVAYIRVIKDMYDEVTTSVRTQVRVTKDFPKKIGLHQRSFLSLYLFTLVWMYLQNTSKMLCQNVCFL